MDKKTDIFILVAIACVIFVAMIACIPFKIKKLKKECGALKMKLKSDFPMRSILIFVVCGALIGIVPLRDFPVYISVIFLLTALIGASIAAKEVANSGMNGVFENMIISDTTAIKYDDILSLPTVSYEKQEDTTQVDFRLLEVLPKKGAKITLVFPDETVRNKALDIILAQCPRLSE